MKFFVNNAQPGRPSSRSRDWRRTTREAPSEWEPDEMPARESFWTTYRWRLVACAAALLLGGLYSIPLFVNEGIGGHTYLSSMALVMSVVPAVVLPIYWYWSFRRLRERYRQVLEEPGDSESGGREESAEDSAVRLDLGNFGETIDDPNAERREPAASRTEIEA